MTTPPGILEWRDGQLHDDWPLASGFGPRGFLLDALFHQLDGFVPSLVAVTVIGPTMVLELRMDEGTVFAATTAGQPETWIEGSGGRMLGVLVFGPGLPEALGLWQGRRQLVNRAFHASTVQGVPSSLGLFSLEGLSGDVQVQGRDNVIFFEQDGQAVTWHAGHVPEADSRRPLLSLNRMPPVNGALFLQETAVLKVAAQRDRLLLSAPSALNSSVVAPTLPAA